MGLWLRPTHALNLIPDLYTLIHCLYTCLHTSLHTCLHLRLQRCLYICAFTQPAPAWILAQISYACLCAWPSKCLKTRLSICLRTTCTRMTHVHTHIYTHVCIHGCIRVYTHVHTHVYDHTHVYIHVYTHVHTVSTYDLHRHEPRFPIAEPYGYRAMRTQVHRGVCTHSSMCVYASLKYSLWV